MDRDVTEALAKLYRSVGLAPLEPPVDGSLSAARLVAAARHFHRRLRARLNEALEEVGFSYARFEILELVDADPDLHVGSLAQQLGSTRQSVHEPVVRLEAAGLVEVLQPDAGVRGLRLTDAGREALERCSQALEPFHLLFGRLSAGDRKALNRALTAAEVALRPPPRR